MNDEIAENILRKGKDGVKENIMNGFADLADLIASDMYAAVEEVMTLRKENVELRARLENAIILPCKVGDIVYVVSFSSVQACDKNGLWYHAPTVEIIEVKVNEKNIYRVCDDVSRGAAFFTREAAEARLAELKGK